VVLRLRDPMVDLLIDRLDLNLIRTRCWGQFFVKQIRGL
jgi:hypothetical protein